MYEVTWQSAAPFIAAGGLCKIETNTDFTDLLLEIYYCGGRGHITREADFLVKCISPYYFDMRRTHDCETACTTMLDAYLHRDSPLITALKSHQLNGMYGTVYSEEDPLQSELNHLEIIGGVSVNIIFASISILSNRSGSELEAWPR